MESLGNYSWIEKNPPETLSLIDQILFNRNITDPEEKKIYTDPSFETHLRDPLLMKDMRKGVNVIVEAIQKEKKILVFGDYDADGVTATALFFSFLSEIKANCDYHIPHRIKDGYGITVAGVEHARSLGTNLIITVDNGIVANEAIDRANELGIQVVITDHHKAGEEVPNATAVINPNQPACQYPFKGISGVGVAYKVIWQVSKHFMDDAKRLHFLKWNLDLVAMGTVADVMPLIDENRVFVSYGLKVIGKSKRPGIKALLDILFKETDKNDKTVIGYQLGPRINAAGRLEAADLALETLLTTDYNDALVKAKQLDSINTKRREMTEEAVKEAELQINHEDSIYILDSENWHPGIIGLIAARMAENYHKPVMAFTYDKENGLMKSSGRSPAYFDITKAIMSTKDLMINGGGHRQACGCSIYERNFIAFKEKLKAYTDEEIQNVNVSPEIQIETILKPELLNLETFFKLDRLSPYGQGFPDPIFKVERIKLIEYKQVGFDKKHLLCTFEVDRKNIKGIGFRIGSFAKQLNINDIVDVAFTISKNEWRGNVNVQLIIKDIKL